MATFPKRVSPGDGRPSAAQWNGLVDGAERARRMDQGAGGDNAGPLLRDPSVILIQNATGGALPAYSILGLDVPLILPDKDLDQFKGRIVMRGIAPNQSHTGKFVVTRQALAAGGIGPAVLDGACQVKINFNDEADSSADIKEGNTESLESGSGTAAVVWKQDGKGLLWAIVILQTGGGELTNGKIQGQYWMTVADNKNAHSLPFFTDPPP